MVNKEFTIKLTVYVKSEDEKGLPEQREVENLACGLLLTPPATDTDAKWNVCSALIRNGE